MCVRCLTVGIWSSPTTKWSASGMFREHWHQQRLDMHRLTMNCLLLCLTVTPSKHTSSEELFTNHRPLVSIVKSLSVVHPAGCKESYSTYIQKYDLNLRYKWGQMIFLADTLSQAYLHDINAWELIFTPTGISGSYGCTDHDRETPATI